MSALVNSPSLTRSQAISLAAPNVRSHAPLGSMDIVVLGEYILFKAGNRWQCSRVLLMVKALADVTKMRNASASGVEQLCSCTEYYLRTRCGCDAKLVVSDIG